MNHKPYLSRTEPPAIPLVLRSQHELAPSSAIPQSIIFKEHRIRGMLNIVSFVHACNVNQKKSAATVHQYDSSTGFLEYAEWFRPFLCVFDDIVAMHPKEIEDFHVCEEIRCFYIALEQFDGYVSVTGLFEQNRPQMLIYIQSRANQLNTFIKLICQQMNCNSIKLAKRRRKKKSASNLKSCRKLINECFHALSKLVILRLDLGLKVPLETFDTTHDFNDLKKSFHSLDNLKLLKLTAANMMNNKRHNKIINAIVGYMLKFEHGIKKGFHIHAIFILDGNKHQKDGYFASEITKYWSKLTDGNGCTYNCHMAKNKYKKLGIGMIHHQDFEKRNVLDTCIKYLCKQEQYFVFSSLKNVRTLQISKPPKRRSNAGRPRLNGMANLNSNLNIKGRG